MSDFCDECGVTMDLHDGEDSCEDAEFGAQRLERMERLMFGWIR